MALGHLLAAHMVARRKDHKCASAQNSILLLRGLGLPARVLHRALAALAKVSSVPRPPVLLLILHALVWRSPRNAETILDAPHQGSYFRDHAGDEQGYITTQLNMPGQST